MKGTSPLVLQSVPLLSIFFPKYALIMSHLLSTRYSLQPARSRSFPFWGCSLFSGYVPFHAPTEALNLFSLPICRLRRCHNLGLLSSSGVSGAKSPLIRPNALRSHSRRDVLLLSSYMRPFPRHWGSFKHSLDCRKASIYWFSMHCSSGYQTVRQRKSGLFFTEESEY
jgi:hypothetical protein